MLYAFIKYTYIGYDALTSVFCSGNMGLALFLALRKFIVMNPNNKYKQILMDQVPLLSIPFMLSEDPSRYSISSLIICELRHDQT